MANAMLATTSYFTQGAQAFKSSRYDPASLKCLHDLASCWSETEPDLSTAIPTSLAAATETEIRKLESDVKGPLYDAHHPKHKERMKRYRELLAVRARAQGARHEKAGAA